ncbi:site-specific integrase [Blastochloris tepida]|uniref:Integrase n=1 Tax=Blastochloris tepida TaxID=2233851 RepID=A0A348G1J3_9HYPH|nr:site-specific integrase [Blastochloris tepida]BBF93426.1 integrase [Blastochloris tepida]
MPAVKITRKVLADLAPRERVFVQYDTEVPGFGVRVTPAGAASWIVEYRPNGGGRRAPTRRMTLGSTKKLPLEKARAEAERIIAPATLGSDPAADRREQREAATIADLIETFMRESVRPRKKPRTVELYDSYFRLHVIPTLGTRKARDVTHADVARLHRKLGAEKPVTANRVVMLLSGLFTWAGKAGEVEHDFNPARGIEKFRETAKERFLSTEELAALGAALAEAEGEGIPWGDSKPTAKHGRKEENRRSVFGPHAVAAIRLLLLTGARLREVLHLRWEHVDTERGLLLLPDSKTGKKTIVLGAPALAVLDALPRLGAYVVPGSNPDRPRHDLHKVWAAVCRRAGLEGVRIHDLRHTHASYGAGAGMSLQIIGRLLGHSQPSTTQRYAHLADDPLRRAANTIGGQIVAALAGQPPAGEVVPLRGKR